MGEKLIRERILLFAILALLLAYLLGSISFSYLMGKLSKGIDVRQHGSGNAGATNTLRVLGLGPALTVLALDIGKGVLAVWIGKWMADDLWVAVLCGILAIAGHNWPIYFSFRGGKGIATTIGVTVTLCPIPFLIAGGLAIVIVAVTKYVSLGSLVFTGLLPVIVLLMNGSSEIVWASLVLAVLAWYRHRSNIAKLLRGEENKLGKKA